MEKTIKNFLLGLGIALILLGILFWYLNWINFTFMIVFIIAGIILIMIEIYNWGAGTDLSHKQETPIENTGIEYQRF